MNKDLHISTWTFNRFLDPAFLISTAIMAIASTAFVVFPGWLTFSLGIFFVFVWVVILYFFRDPDRHPVRKPGLVVGPADGVVVSIEPFQENRYMHSETVRVSMFLSLWDVHVQRAPLGGIVKLVEHQPGKFLQAFREEASEVNEYIAMVIETDFGKIMVKQISGIVARRCMNYARPGDSVDTGQRYGHIKFGSRVDLFLPPDAQVLVKVGDKVSGGLTRIAQLQGGEQ